MPRVILYLILVILVGCTTTRSITNSGKVTPKGNLVVGGSYAINVPTQTITSIGSALSKSITEYAKYDTIRPDATFDRINKASISYALDPIDAGFNFFVRYGVVKRFDIGYKRSFGANIFDCQYQFMGSTGYINDPEAEKLYGSIGLQYSSQDISYLSFLKKLDNRLNFEFARKDLMIPLILSFAFGNEETFGSVSAGLAYTHSWIAYSTNPVNVFDFKNTTLMAMSHHQQYSSLGAFLNFKLGYKRVYVIPSLAFFYQKYGEYELLSTKTVLLKGVTIIPAIALQLRIGRSQQKTKKS